jgi:hypothetical protein
LEEYGAFIAKVITRCVASGFPLAAHTHNSCRYSFEDIIIILFDYCLAGTGNGGSSTDVAGYLHRMFHPTPITLGPNLTRSVALSHPYLIEEIDPGLERIPP